MRLFLEVISSSSVFVSCNWPSLRNLLLAAKCVGFFPLAIKFKQLVDNLLLPKYSLESFGFDCSFNKRKKEKKKGFRVSASFKFLHGQIKEILILLVGCFISQPPINCSQLRYFQLEH
jgi:hypothetical protein